MRVALVLPLVWVTETPALGLAYLASALKNAGHEVKIFDYNLTSRSALTNLSALGPSLELPKMAPLFCFEEPFSDVILPALQPSMKTLVSEIAAWRPDVMGFSIFFRSFLCSREILKLYKARHPEIKVVYGGPSMSALNYEQVETELRHGLVDAAVIGEGEATLLELLERWEQKVSLKGCRGISHIEAGQMIHEEPRSAMPLGSILPPDFSGFDLPSYTTKVLPIIMSRGCIAKCTFCTETRHWPKFRFRSAKEVFEELVAHAEKYGTSEFFFNDSLVNGNFDVLKSLCLMIIESGRTFEWGGYARIDKRMTPELLAQMAQAGCKYLRYGFESGAQEVLDLMQKRTTVEVARQVVKDTHHAGIQVKLQVVVGFPGEDETHFQETLDFLEVHAKYISAVYPSTMGIHPGLPVADDPSKYKISTAKPIYGHDWETEDGKNNHSVRKERFSRVEDLIRRYEWEDAEFFI